MLLRFSWRINKIGEYRTEKAEIIRFMEYFIGKKKKKKGIGNCETSKSVKIYMEVCKCRHINKKMKFKSMSR